MNMTNTCQSSAELEDCKIWMAGNSIFKNYLIIFKTECFLSRFYFCFYFSFIFLSSPQTVLLRVLNFRILWWCRSVAFPWHVIFHTDSKFCVLICSAHFPCPFCTPALLSMLPTPQCLLSTMYTTHHIFRRFLHLSSTHSSRLPSFPLILYLLSSAYSLHISFLHSLFCLHSSPRCCRCVWSFQEAVMTSFRTQSTNASLLMKWSTACAGKAALTATATSWSHRMA